MAIALISYSSCDRNNKLCEETRMLSIIPGERIGDYELGMNEEQIKDLLCSGFEKKSEEGLLNKRRTTYYFIENMSFVFRNNILLEINVWGTFKGSFKEIDLNYDKPLLEEFGDVIVHKGEYRILDIPGISFGKEDSEEGNL